jgi:RNA-directed DNA polymerase
MIEEGRSARPKPRTAARHSKGSLISPALANLYMPRFVLGWKKLGLERSLGTRIVTYADDLVILCSKGKGEEALQWLCEIMGRLKSRSTRRRREYARARKKSSTSCRA